MCKYHVFLSSDNNEPFQFITSSLWIKCLFLNLQPLSRQSETQETSGEPVLINYLLPQQGLDTSSLGKFTTFVYNVHHSLVDSLCTLHSCSIPKSSQHKFKKLQSSQAIIKCLKIPTSLFTQQMNSLDKSIDHVCVNILRFLPSQSTLVMSTVATSKCRYCKSKNKLIFYLVKTSQRSGSIIYHWASNSWIYLPLDKVPTSIILTLDTSRKDVCFGCKKCKYCRERATCPQFPGFIYVCPMCSDSKLLNSSN